MHPETAPKKPLLPGQKNWTLDDVPWHAFDAAKVDPCLLNAVKAAALVEYNAGDYAAYLSNVFKDDPAFLPEIAAWAAEETQHGAALGRWAQLADPSFNFAEAFARFTAGYKINTQAQQSIRGSRVGELLARCIVETGTSNYYTALADASTEPVLKAICQFIAGDELRHYKLFYTHMNRHRENERIGRLQRLKIGLSRIAESEDDELAYAYYAATANDNPTLPHTKAVYNRQHYTNRYIVAAFGYYRANHVRRMVSMVFKACGLNTQNRIAGFTSTLAWLSLRLRLATAKRVVAKKGA